MDKLLKIGFYHPWKILAIIIAISIYAGFAVQNLRFEITAEGMMVKDDPKRTFYEQVLTTFGSDNVTILYFEDENLFSHDKLLALQSLVRKLDNSPLVDRTVSLFSVRRIYTRDGLTYTDPYLKYIPDGQDKINEVRHAALQNPLVAKNLLSDDGKAMAINIFLDTTKYERGFDALVNQFLIKTLEPYRSQFSEMFFIGDPYVRVGLTERIQEDLQTIVPAAVIFLVLSLAIVLRQANASLVPLVTSAISILWTLALMAELNIPINVMTSIIPALLIIIGSTEDIHLLAECRFSSGDKLTKQMVFDRMANNMWLSVLLTFITTYLGFFSISFGNLELLQQFGLVASTGLILNFAITVLVVPMMLRLLDFTFGKRTPLDSHSKNLFRDIALKIYRLTRTRHGQVKALLVIIIGLCLHFMQDVHINNNVMDYFDDDAPIQRQAEKLHQNLSGIQTFSIVMSGTDGTFTQAPYLQDIWDLQEYLKDTGFFDSSYSFADFIGVIHAGLDSEWGDMVYLPSRNEVVREYISLMDQEYIESYVSPDYSQTRILVRHNLTSSEELRLAIQAIESYANTWLDPSIDVQVTGENYLNNRATDYLAWGQFQSLLLLLLAIFLIVSGLFMNFKAGLVAILANILPMLVLFAVMGWSGIPINTGTSMVAAISLGVCVDYTMHFMVRYQRLSKQHDIYPDPLEETFREESIPIISTALALSAGFLTLALSDFPPVKQFGLLSAMVVIVALFSTFVVSALILRNIRLITVWDIMSMKVRQQVLNFSPLFRDMSAWQAKRIIALSEIQAFPHGEQLAHQNDKVNQLFVLLDGEVEGWRTRPDGSSYMVNRVSPGGVFGVLLPDSGQLCFADMTASKDCRVMVMEWENLNQIARSYPRLAVTLYKNLSLIIAYMLQTADTIIDRFHDEHSGALTSKMFAELLDSMVKRANRYHENLGFISFKTRFKDDITPRDTIRFNRELGQVIHKLMRSPDSLGRFDQETVCIACPNTGLESLDIIRNRIVSRIKAEESLKEFDFEVDATTFALEEGESFENFYARINCGKECVRRVCVNCEMTDYGCNNTEEQPLLETKPE
jgi:predicted RND superfamily exporter protein/CRP-like cAMP-binding protein